MDNTSTLAAAIAEIKRRNADDAASVNPVTEPTNVPLVGSAPIGASTDAEVNDTAPRPYPRPNPVDDSAPKPEPANAREAEREQRAAILTHLARNPESFRLALSKGMSTDLFDTFSERPEKLVFAVFEWKFRNSGTLPPRVVIWPECVTRMEHNSFEFDLRAQDEVRNLIDQIYNGCDAGWEIVRGLLADFLFDRRVARQISGVVKFGFLTDDNFEELQPALADIKALRSSTNGGELLPPQPVGQLIAAHQKLREPIIHGLLRDGETMNLIAPSKAKKSWLVLNLSLSVAGGQAWLGFKTEPGRVLIIDNELHAETVAYRLPRVAEKMGLTPEKYAEQIAYCIMRGARMDIYSLKAYLQRIQPGAFKAIILDALYRFLPPGTDENDNGAMCNLYNQIDSYAAMLKSAFILVHHTSKGIQSGRAVTDVGSGAGAISRAADCHLVLRAHSEENAVVLDASPRSWPPVPSTCSPAPKFPLWEPATDLDPAGGRYEESEFQNRRLRIQPPPPGLRRLIPTKPAKWTTARCVATFIGKTPKLPAEIMPVQAESHPRIVGHDGRAASEEG